MKKLQLWIYGSLSIVMFIVSCIGCANIHYISPTKEEFSYSRLGMQKINGFKMTKDSNGLIGIEFDNQEGAVGDIAETLKNISAIMLKTPQKE